MSAIRTLVTSPEAQTFINTMNTNSGRKAHLGDPEYYKDTPALYNAVVGAHQAVEGGLNKIAALTSDLTRNEFMRHAAAREVAGKTKAAVEAAKGAAKREAANRRVIANDMIQSSLEANPDRAPIQTEIRGWIREQATKEDGPAIIRAAAANDKEVVAVLYHSPLFLLGLAEVVRDNIVFDGMKRYEPVASKMIDDSAHLDKQVDKYDQVARSIDASFYNGAMADKAATRVEV